MTVKKPVTARAGAVLVAALLLASCTSGGEEDTSVPPVLATPTAVATDVLDGPVRPALLLVQSWFFTGADGNSQPGPARLEIWRAAAGTWAVTRVEDPESNAFHKALPWEGGILTIGAERALLKKWTYTDGRWNADVLWEGRWNGRYDRLRDVEIGDVTGDGRDEMVIATHDAGVVAVVTLDAEGGVSVLELGEEPDTFVHEIEVGDIDGDGTNEIFCTPSDRNNLDVSQPGGIVMYRWDGSTFRRTEVEQQKRTHAKEILVRDMDGNGRAELFAVLEGHVDEADRTRSQHPVEIRQYSPAGEGRFAHRTIATIDDRQTRFLTAGDFDGDGEIELIAAALRAGLFRLTPVAGERRWKRELLDRESSGFEHAILGADLDGDGRPELYVAADDQHLLRRYRWENGKFERTDLGRMNDDVLTWNITTGRF